MSDKRTSKLQAEVYFDLTDEQKSKIKPFIDSWQSQKGLVLGSLGEDNGVFRVGFRQVPPELGEKIIQIVDQFVEGENDVNS